MTEKAVTHTIEMDPVRLSLLLGFATGVGVTVGYALAANRLKAKYEAIVEIEIEGMKAHYASKEADLIAKQKELANQPKPDLEKVGTLAEVGKIIDDQKYTPEERKAIEEVELEVKAERDAENNVFPTGPLPEWDYAVEERRRDPSRPYVIHKDEFTQGVEDADDAWSQETLTYFEGDDVLSDSRDHIIDVDRHGVVGEENLSRFGHGSGDPNVVYIRNIPRQIDLEIVRSTGKYAEEVHGFVEHAEPRRHKQPRFRDASN